MVERIADRGAPRAVPLSTAPPAPGTSVFMKAADLLSVAGARPRHRALRRHADRLELLNEVHRALGRSMALPELLELILDNAWKALAPGGGRHRAARWPRPLPAGDVAARPGLARRGAAVAHPARRGDREAPGGAGLRHRRRRALRACREPDDVRHPQPDRGAALRRPGSARHDRARFARPCPQLHRRRPGAPDLARLGRRAAHPQHRPGRRVGRAPAARRGDEARAGHPGGPPAARAAGARRAGRCTAAASRRAASRATTTWRPCAATTPSSSA